RWFFPSVAALDGCMNLTDVFDPRTHVLCYAATQVKAEHDGWAVLHCGASGYLAAWVNGQSAGMIENANDWGADKLVTPVYLRHGWNQILIKAAVVEDTAMAFQVRVCKPE